MDTKEVPHMKKLVSLLLVLALCSALALSAAAEATVISTNTISHSVTLCNATNCYYYRTNAGYQLFDAEGNALSAAYGDMYHRQHGRYLEVRDEGGINTYGLLDGAGKELLPFGYGDFQYIDDNWVLAYVLEPADGDTSEYKDSDGNRYNVGRTDVLYKGQLIGSLTRDDYVKSYVAAARGSYLYVKKSSSHVYWLDSSFNRIDVESNDYISTAEYYDFGKKGVLHNPTQQYAFTPGCTLKAEDVDQYVWFDDEQGALLDLQGNVIASGLVYSYAYHEKDHFLMKRDGLYGIVAADGTQITEPKYAQIAESNGELFSSGYNALLDENGCLSYVDKTGAVTASVSYQLSSNDYKGFLFNSPFAVVNNMGRYLVITAACGELEETYEDFTTPGAKQRVLAVKKGDSWGCIDLYGNTVVPFEYTNAPSVSGDGSLVAGRRSFSEYVVYHLSFDDAAAEEEVTVPEAWTEAVQSGEEADAEPVLNADAWECTCGVINTGKFCPECGSAKPAPTPTPTATPTATPAPTSTPAPTATPAPVEDGSWVCESCGITNTSKFCPECGGPKPEAPAEPECASCGYKPEGEAPKFCPECGTKF